MSDINSRNQRPNPSDSVIKRLPRYFRYLRILMRNGISRISSAELSKMMNVTASQIRQDLNCFGGFGQQGYGYNVEYLYAKICDLLGVGAGLCSVRLPTLHHSTCPPPTAGRLPTACKSSFATPVNGAISSTPISAA